MVSIDKPCSDSVIRMWVSSFHTLAHYYTFPLWCFFSGVEGSNGWCPGGTGRLSARAVSLQQGKRFQGSGCPPRCCALSAGAAAGCFSLPETQFPFPPAWCSGRRAANKPQWLCPRRGLCAVSICELIYASHKTSSCFICYFPNVELKSGLSQPPPHTHRKSTFDMFNFLASQHRQLPESRPCDDEEDDVMLKSSRLETQQHIWKSSPQNENSVINYSPICHSKPVRHLRNTNEEIFDEICELSDPP